MLGVMSMLASLCKRKYLRYSRLSTVLSHSYGEADIGRLSYVRAYKQEVGYRFFFYRVTRSGKVVTTIMSVFEVEVLSSIHVH